MSKMIELSGGPYDGKHVETYEGARTYHVPTVVAFGVDPIFGQVVYRPKPGEPAVNAAGEEIWDHEVPTPPDIPDTFGDFHVSRVLRTYPDIHVIGKDRDFTNLSPWMSVPDPPGTPEPPHPGHGGVFVAMTETGTDGRRWRLWHWEPDADQWERDGDAYVGGPDPYGEIT